MYVYFYGTNVWENNKEEKQYTHIYYMIYIIYTCTYIHICINIYFIRSVCESRLYKRQKTYEVVHHTHIHIFIYFLYILKIFFL